MGIHQQINVTCPDDAMIEQEDKRIVALPDERTSHCAPEGQTLGSQTVAEGPVFQALPGYFPKDFFATRSHPWNRAGFRYQACGRVWPSNAPSRATKGGEPGREETQDLDEVAFYRTIESAPAGLVRWSWEDRSRHVHISKDGLSITTDRGFRTARANVPIRQGKWFFEVFVRRAGGELNLAGRSDPEEAHVRIGIARREAGLNVPVGMDGYSYAIRDKTGQKVHLSRRAPYGEPWGSGDVVGVLVSLPRMREPGQGVKRRRVPIWFRNQLYFESAEYPVSKEMEDLAEAVSPARLGQTRAMAVDKRPGASLPILKGSELSFFKNGVLQGVAFEGLLDFLPFDAGEQHGQVATGAAEVSLANSPSLHQDDGTLGYYPCVSVYGGGIATLNAGPDFRFPPPGRHGKHDTPTDPGCLEEKWGSKEQEEEKLWRPLSELYPLHLAEQWRLDELEQSLSRAAHHCQDPRDPLSLPKAAANKRKRTQSPSLSATVAPTTTAGPKAGSTKRKKFKKPLPSRLSSPSSSRASKPQSLCSPADDAQKVVDSQQTVTNLQVLCQAAKATQGDILEATSEQDLIAHPMLDQIIVSSPAKVNDEIEPNLLSSGPA